MSAMAYAGNPQPGFGSIGAQSARAMEPIFRASQDIIWEMLILDVFALWIPRIVNAMERGSVKTHLNEITQDPKHQGQSSAKQIWTWMHKNVRGWNWPNGIEETWREIQSVPMILGAQSMFYGIAMLNDPAGKGILVSKNDLEPLTKAFREYCHVMGTPRLTALLNRRDGGFRKLSNGFMENMLKHHFQEFGNQPLAYRYMTENTAPVGMQWTDMRRVNKGKLLPESARQQTVSWLKKHFSAAPEKATYNQAIEKWVQDWARAMSKNARYNQYVQPLESVLNELVKNYNERLIKLHPEHALDGIRLPMSSQSVKNANQFVEALDKFMDVMRATYKQSARALPNSKESATALMDTALTTLHRGLITRKALYSLGVMGVGVILYFASSLHAQSNNSYPANRLYHEGQDPNVFPEQAMQTGNRLSEALDQRQKEAKK